MEKICLSQNNFDKLLYLALSNCQSNKDIRPLNHPNNRISFFERRPGMHSNEDEVIVNNNPPQPFQPNDSDPYPHH